MDTADDLAFFRRVLAELPGNPLPDMATISTLVDTQPEIARINANVGRSTLYRS